MKLGSYRPMTPAQMAELVRQVAERDGPCYLSGKYEHVCEGRTWAAHLVPQRQLKLIYRYGAWHREGEKIWHPLEPYTPDRTGRTVVTLGEICGDPRNAVAMCDRMHTLFDQSLDVRRECLDLMLPEFAEFYTEYRLEPQVERYFGLAPFALDPPLGKDST